MTDVSGRRADIDWLRIVAFGLLILYHVLLVYAPWDWHVNSLRRIEALQYVALATNPWRLSLLFLISGAALRFMTIRRTSGQVARARLARLVPPLIFGALVLVPPQAWMEAVDKGWWTGGFLPWLAQAFWPAVLAGGPPLNHLWFVLYIAAYSLAALALFPSAAARERAQGLLARALSGWGLLLVPFAYLAICRLALFPGFGLTNRLLADPYNHAMSFALFAAGFLLAGRDDVWRRFERFRWGFAGIALAALALLIVLEVWRTPALAPLRHMVFALDQWATLAAAMGFSSRHLRAADGPARRYLTDAIFPCYLAHQTLLVAAIFVLKPAGLPLALEAPLLTAVTLGGSLAIYELARRSGPMRPLWGLKPLEKKPRTQGAEPAVTDRAAP